MLITTPLNKIKAEEFDVNFIAKYDLYIHLQPNYLNVCVFDTEENRCILFENYNFEEAKSDKTLLQCLEEVWEANHLLSAGFWHKVVVILTGQDFVFIPYEHFNEEAAPNYLKLNCEFDAEKQNIHHLKHYELDSTCCFTVHKALEDWLSSKYNNTPVQYVHSNSCFIHTLLSENEEGLSLLLHEDSMTLAMVKDKQLQFVNSFPYNDVNDVLYFTLFVMDEMNIIPEENSINLWGSVLDYSTTKGLLGKYIKEVKTGERPQLKYSVGFDDTLPGNYGYDLFGAYYLLR